LQPRAEGGNPFQHGVASGDPMADRVILWTRVSGYSTAVAVDWELALDPNFERVLRRSGDGVDAAASTRAEPEADFTVKLDVTGLQPATHYYYRFGVEGQWSPLGRTRTAPAAGAQQLRFALVSCSDYTTGYFNAYKVLARRDVDAVIHVGDYFYEYGSASPLGRDPEPPHEIVTLGDYRQRHSQYRGDADLQAMTAAHPLIVVWDDHESTNNSWADGAQNHQPETEGDWQERKQAAVQAYAEWLPIRLPEPGNPLKIWRHLPYGDLVDLLMLDTRLQRNVPETDTSTTGTESGDPERSMLGAEQKAWLLERMRESQARGTAWRVLAQQTMMSPHRNNPDPRYSPLPYLPTAVAEEMGLRQGGGNEGGDNWGAYQFERDGLMQSWRAEGVQDNIILTGDIHTAWASDVVEDPYTPFNPVTGSLSGVPGYNLLTGEGSVAVEFTSMSVTSNNLADSPEGAVLRPLYNTAVIAANPNVAFHDAGAHGFVLVEISREAAVGEFWNVGSVLQPFSDADDAESLGRYGTDHSSAGFANHITRR
ncbi:MAG: alkaline phosphatase D family protein, partial [Oceanococcaceae bacterium]